MTSDISRYLSDSAALAAADSDRRRALGIYYTPPDAAAALTKWAIRDAHDTVLEPSFGGCTILEAAGSRLQQLGCIAPAAQIFGFDIDHAAFRHLRRVFPTAPSTNFRKRDFLEVQGKPKAVSTIVANPPFVSYHRMGRHQRDVVRAWRARHSPPFAMTASLWAYFLWHSLSFLATGGRLAFVLPSAALASDYAQPLMQALRLRFARISSYRINEQLFIQAGAEERTVLLLAEEYDPVALAKCMYVERTARSIADVEYPPQAGRATSIAGRDNSSLILPKDCATDLLRSLASKGSLCSLKCFARVQIGEVVGDTPYLVRPLHEWRQIGVPQTQLKPLITRSRQLLGLRISGREVNSAYAGISRLLAPSPTRLSTSVSKYLNSYPAKKLRANRTFAKREPWYLTPYDPTAMAFIASMSHISPRVVLNAAKVSCSNGLYKLSAQVGIRWATWIAAASLTTVFRLTAEMHARVRGSGGLKLEPRDISDLLIPSAPPTWTSADARQFTDRMDRLLRAGEHAAATFHADQLFLIAPGVLSLTDLASLKERLHELRGTRLASTERLTTP